MIRQGDRAKIYFALAAILLFLFSFAVRLSQVIPVFLLSLVIYIRFRDSGLKNPGTLYLAFLFTIFLSAAYLIIDYGWPKSYIPFCIIPMLATLLFNQLELSFIITLASSVTMGFLASSNLELAVSFFISGLLSSLLVLNARRRMTVIRAGVITGLLQAVVLLLIEYPLFKPQHLYSMLTDYSFFIVNGFVSSIIVLGVLPVFEYLFKTITNISLLELADFNHPLMQRLVLEAPGTYHHSLVVGNLSEAACNAVGANALLARIGAYYHDVGKLSKPDYFSENQCVENNKHDTLSPTMSKLVIISHIKDGVELAEKYKLNPRIIEFIRQHHGSGLVYFFYRRALEELEEDEEIKEEVFRYPGPKPDIKETAVVLLADSVEAATRTLKDPSLPKIQEVVHKIINNKFIDGQLDECDLTLKDLEKISTVFVRLLGGIYHSRVTYPEKTESGNNHNKHSEENSRQPEKDKKSNP